MDITWETWKTDSGGPALQLFSMDRCVAILPCTVFGWPRMVGNYRPELCSFCADDIQGADCVHSTPSRHYDPTWTSSDIPPLILWPFPYNFRVGGLHFFLDLPKDTRNEKNVFWTCEARSVDHLSPTPSLSQITSFVHFCPEILARYLLPMFSPPLGRRCNSRTQNASMLNDVRGNKMDVHLHFCFLSLICSIWMLAKYLYVFADWMPSSATSEAVTDESLNLGYLNNFRLGDATVQQWEGEDFDWRRSNRSKSTFKRVF